jgi:hypothetical protein
VLLAVLGVSDVAGVPAVANFYVVPNFLGVSVAACDPGTCYPVVLNYQTFSTIRLQLLDLRFFSYRTIDYGTIDVEKLSDNLSIVRFKDYSY